jgi:RNA polymerase sigma-70 factor, ECF subfamily
VVLRRATATRQGRSYGEGGPDPLAVDARLAAAGDDAAFERLVRATQADVWRVCRHLAPRGAADDLAQETYLRAWRALPGFRGEASPRTWLLAIARRAAADQVRTSYRNLQTTADAALREAPGPDQTGVVDLGLLIAGLDDDRRLAIFLTQHLGLSYAEAAQVCDCPIGTIRSRVARARSELVEALRTADAQ